ncbi:MAG: hypothetical protein ACYDBT_02575 [Desulfobulbaceae bacterium]
MNRKNRDAKRRGLLLPLLLAIVLSLASKAGQAAEFVLLFSNDNHGELEPCG